MRDLSNGRGCRARAGLGPNVMSSPPALESQELDSRLPGRGGARLKGRHDSGDKGNFESGQNRRKACCYM